MKLLTTLLLPVLVLCGCAQMNVNVSILDRKFWSSPEYLSSSISEQVAIMVRDRGDSKFATDREDIKLAAHKVLSGLAQAGALDPNDVPLLAENLDQFVDKAFKDAENNFKKAFTQFGIATAVPPPSDRLAILFEAQSQLDAGYASIYRTKQQVGADLRTTILADRTKEKLKQNKKLSDKAAQEDQKQLASRAESEYKKETRGGFIGERGIHEDPLASAVVFAPESYWKRPDPPSGINETYASGILGNTDIAVKMEAVGSFTIKGVRLDASKITQATFAVGRQAIKTVAALYGIPLPTAEAKTLAPAPATPFAETPIGFESPDRRRAAAAEALLDRRLARLTLLETILIQRKALTNPETTAAAEVARATALETVKKVFTANRPVIDPPAASTK